MFNFIERRKFARDRRLFKRVQDSFFVTYELKYPFNVHLEFKDKELDALAQDLSEAGIGLLTNYEIPPDVRLNLKFTLFNEDAVGEQNKSRAFELEAQIRYQVLTQKNAYRLGLSFMKLSSDDRAFIAAYIKIQSLKAPFDEQ